MRKGFARGNSFPPCTEEDAFPSGCRARAYAYFKDYLAPDAGCKFNQEFWEETEKEEPYLANF